MNTYESFKNFIVTNFNDKYVFIDVKIEDKEKFYKSLFSYFFDEEMLLNYSKKKVKIDFTPSKRNYVLLYKMLEKFIDKENEIISIDTIDIDSEIIDIIISDLASDTIDKNENDLRIRLDKIGKIGEYLFSCLLSEYFKFDCAIPKLDILTNRNMSIFGIDVIFYSEEHDLLLLGESKVSKNIDNGINL